MSSTSPRASPASTDLESVLHFMNIGGQIAMLPVVDIYKEIYPGRIPESYVRKAGIESVTPGVTS
jgi:hypothetical protein